MPDDLMSINIGGLDQLQRNLEALPVELQHSVLNDSLLAGGSVIADAMVEGAPRGESHDGLHVADQIVVQIEKKPVGSAAEVYVGPSKKVAYRVRWLEFGAAAHALAVKRKQVLASADAVFGAKAEHPGIQPHPFMRAALQSAGQAAIEAIAAKLRTLLPDAVKKVNR